MKYESEILYELMKRDGLLNPSQDHLPYESELKEKYVNDVEGAYPKLQDYRAEWLNYAYNNPIGEFPYVTLSDVTNATIENVVPYAYKSAILKGNTKYRDIDTGDILDTFDETKNLELVSVKMPVLTTTGKNTIYKVKYETLTEDIQPTSYSNVGYGLLDNNDSWTLSFPSSQWIRAYGYDSNGNYTENFIQFTEHENNKYIIKPSNNLTKIIKFRFWTDEEPQLEKGTIATTYEPHKSNILTVNEDVTLRSNGDVYDELNLLTGRLTQRIDENNEVLSQEVVKTVDLSHLIKPYEGTNHYQTSSETFSPIAELSVPVVSTGEQTLNDILTSE